MSELRAADLRVLRAIYVVAFLYWAAMVTALHVPIPKREGGKHPLPKNSDKLIHFGMYGLLAGLFSYALDERARQRPTVWPRTAAARYGLAFTVCTLHGVLDEVTQPLTRRFNEPSDMAADAVGVAAAILVYHWIGSRLPHARVAPT